MAAPAFPHKPSQYYRGLSADSPTPLTDMVYLRTRSMLCKTMLPGTVSGHCKEQRTAKCRELLCPTEALPHWGWPSRPPQRALPLLHRSYELMRQTKTLPPILVLPPSTGLRRLPSAPAGSWPFPTLSLQSLCRRLDPYPVVFPWCTYPLLPRGQRPHVMRNTFGTREYPCNATSTGSRNFGAAVIRLPSGSYAR